MWREMVCAEEDACGWITCACCLSAGCGPVGTERFSCFWKGERLQPLVFLLSIVCSLYEEIDRDGLIIGAFSVVVDGAIVVEGRCTFV